MSPVLIMLIFGAFCMILSTLFGGAYYMGYFDTNSSSSSTDPDSSSSSSSSSSNSSSSSTDPDSSSIPLCYQAQSLDCESNEYSNIVTMPPALNNAFLMIKSLLLKMFKNYLSRPSLNKKSNNDATSLEQV